MTSDNQHISVVSSMSLFMLNVSVTKNKTGRNFLTPHFPIFPSSHAQNHNVVIAPKSPEAINNQYILRQMVDFNIAGVISIIVFYILILLVGIWAGKKKPPGEDDSEDVMLAGRSIGVFVGIFTMTGGSCAGMHAWCCCFVVV